MMRKLFPSMMDRPENGNVFGIFIYWLMAFVIFPFVLPLFMMGSWDDHQIVSYIEMIYYLINFCVVVMMMKSYFSESFYKVRINKAKIFKTALLTFAMMIITVIMLARFILLLSGEMVDYLYIFPMSEFSVLIYPDYLVACNPVLGTLCLTVISPVSICGLFYAGGFAPVCCKRPWLAYVVVSVLLLLLTGFDILWRGDSENALMLYLFRLPVHLIACWSYQKTDTVWTPIASLALFNMTTSLLSIALH